MELEKKWLRTDKDDDDDDYEYEHETLYADQLHRQPPPGANKVLTVSQVIGVHLWKGRRHFCSRVSESEQR